MSEIEKDIIADEELFNEEQDTERQSQDEESLVEDILEGESEEEVGPDEEDIDEASEEEETDEDLSEEEEASQPTEDEKELAKTFKMRRLLRAMLRDEDSEGGSMKDMFDDIQISGEWLKRHWSFILIVVVCMLLFVTNRYQAQQEIIEESRLKRELNDIRFIWLTQFCELTRSQRQSQIEETLIQRGDTTLKPRKEAPFLIKAK